MHPNRICTSPSKPRAPVNHQTINDLIIDFISIKYTSNSVGPCTPSICCAPASQRLFDIVMALRMVGPRDYRSPRHEQSSKMGGRSPWENTAHSRISGRQLARNLIDIYHKTVFDSSCFPIASDPVKPNNHVPPRTSHRTAQAAPSKRRRECRLTTVSRNDHPLATRHDPINKRHGKVESYCIISPVRNTTQ